MTEDKELLERVAREFFGCGLDEPARISLARAAITECFRPRPMEDAPRDGSRIDLFQGDRRVPDCYWHRKAKAWQTAHYDRDGYSRLRLPFNPTGWLPLPKVGEK